MIKLPKIKIPISLPRKGRPENAPKEEKEKIPEKTSNQETLVTVEIDSNGVLVSLVGKEKNKIQILDTTYSTYESGDIYTNIHSNTFNDLVLKAYEKVTITNQLPVKRMIIGVNAKNLFNKTSTVRIKRKEPEKKITKSELNVISEKIITKTQMEIEEGHNLQDSLELLNSDTTFAKIDGYITKDLEGFRGNTVEISTFMSFIEKSLLDSILRLSKTLRLEIVTVTPTIYTTNKLLRREDRQNYILVDVGGKNTSVAVVFAGEVSIITSFSVGLKSIYTYIKERANTTEKDVKETLKGDQISENIEKYKREIIEVWAEGLKETLGFVDEIKIYPEQVLIHGLGSKVIDRKDITGKILELKFKDTPTIKKITIEDIDNIENLSTNKHTESLVNTAGIANFGFKLTKNE